MAEGELLVYSRLASADLKTAETISCDAAWCIAPQRRLQRIMLQLASIGPTFSRSVIDRDAHFDRGTGLCDQARK